LFLAHLPLRKEPAPYHDTGWIQRVFINPFTRLPTLKKGELKGDLEYLNNLKTPDKWACKANLTGGRLSPSLLCKSLSRTAIREEIRGRIRVGKITKPSSVFYIIQPGNNH
jgi:hypothetical protein